MGLDIVMIGSKDLAKTAGEDPALAVTVKFLVRNVPEAAALNLGEPEADLVDGHRIGTYSALHLLRGLAVAYDSMGASVQRLSEDDLESTIEEFYASGQDAAPRFRHLIDHSDAEGYYVPMEIGEPIALEFQPPEDDEPDADEEAQSVSIGSSVSLLRELDELQALLGLEGDMGELGEAAFERCVSAHRWPTTAHVWGVLHWYARESADKKLFIAFC